jgi:hypothetical protein
MITLENHTLQLAAESFCLTLSLSLSLSLALSLLARFGFVIAIPVGETAFLLLQCTSCICISFQASLAVRHGCAEK